MRTCDSGACNEDAQAVAKYIKHNSEACTKAACCKAHADQLATEMKTYFDQDLVWKALPRQELPTWIKETHDKKT